MLAAKRDTQQRLPADSRAQQPFGPLRAAPNKRHEDLDSGNKLTPTIAAHIDNQRQQPERIA
jgi:hypothetical protein